MSRHTALLVQNDMEKIGGLRAPDIAMGFVPVGDHVSSPLPDESLGKMGGKILSQPPSCV